MIINPAGRTTTSVAILDALLTLEAPMIEVHISNIHARESFRRALLCVARRRAPSLCGFGINGYALAIDGLAAMTAATQGRCQGLIVARKSEKPSMLEDACNRSRHDPRAGEVAR